jgi:hypothetical protein
MLAPRAKHWAGREKLQIPTTSTGFELKAPHGEPWELHLV